MIPCDGLVPRRVVVRSRFDENPSTEGSGRRTPAEVGIRGMAWATCMVASMIPRQEENDCGTAKAVASVSSVVTSQSTEGTTSKELQES